MNQIIPALSLLALVACDMNKNSPILQDTIKSKYRVGEEYSFKSRPIEPNAVLTVVKVEHQDKVGNIVHVRVDSVKVKTSANSEKYSSVITHMPFSEAALDSSGLRKIGETKVIPDYQEGYSEWRTGFYKGGAVFLQYPLAKLLSTWRKQC